jgi:hypothetical protein
VLLQAIQRLLLLKMLVVAAAADLHDKTKSLGTPSVAAG